MAVPFSNTKLRVPRGFQSLLEGFAREVLRSQPADVYTFGAMYFEELVRRREETGDDDPAQLASKVEDRFYNNTAFQQPTIDPSDPQQQKASEIIQTNYRRHAAEKEAAKLREDKAASEIQSAVRGHQEREALRTTSEEQPTQEQKRQEEQEEEVDIDLNDPEVEMAAMKIQAGFKGYKTRKDMLQKKHEASSETVKEAEAEESSPAPAPQEQKEEAEASKEQQDQQQQQQQEEEKEQQQEEKEQQQQQQEDGAADIDLNDPEVIGAAEKIQAGFRGFQTRKSLKQEKAEEKQEEKEEEKEEEKKEEKEEESIEIDPNNPEQVDAAEKIQAGFRGMRARREVAEMRKQRDSAKEEEEKKEEGEKEEAKEDEEKEEERQEEKEEEEAAPAATEEPEEAATEADAEASESTEQQQQSVQQPEGNAENAENAE